MSISVQVDGIYVYFDGHLSRIADTNTPIPNGSGNFAYFNFLGASINGRNIAFIGSDGVFGFQKGVYCQCDGTLKVIADLTTRIPGRETNFSIFQVNRGTAPTVDGNKVAFLGQHNTNSAGIFLSEAGVLSTIVELSTPLPDGAGTFSGLGEFGAFSMHDGELAFHAGTAAIYKWTGGKLELVARGGPTMSFFGDELSIYSGDVVFRARDPVSGIYGSFDGSIETIIDASEPLDGKPVWFFDLGRQALYENRIAFTVWYSDRSMAMFIAERGETAGKCARPGASQDHPILPQNSCRCPDCSVEDFQCFCFVDTPSDQWYDPPLAFGYECEMASDSLFTRVLEFPTGFDGPFEVSVGGESLGTFGPGQSAQLEGGVRSFRITGIEPLVDSECPDAFPIKLGFSTPMASFIMRALTKNQLPGDCNQDGRIGIADPICLLQDLFVGIAAPIGCEAQALTAILDANGDAENDVSDAVYLLLFLFAGGPPHVLGDDCISIADCPARCEP